jgi:hypothetical protein
MCQSAYILQKYMCHVKILGARRVTYFVFHTEYLHTGRHSTKCISPHDLASGIYAPLIMFIWFPLFHNVNRQGCSYFLFASNFSNHSNVVKISLALIRLTGENATSADPLYYISSKTGSLYEGKGKVVPVHTMKVYRGEVSSCCRC